MGKQLSVLRLCSGTIHVAHLSNQKTIITNEASRDQNFGISDHSLYCLISVSDKRKYELLKGLSLKKGAKALHPNQ